MAWEIKALNHATIFLPSHHNGLNTRNLSMFVYARGNGTAAASQRSLGQGYTGTLKSLHVRWTLREGWTIRAMSRYAYDSNRTSLRSHATKICDLFQLIWTIPRTSVKSLKLETFSNLLKSTLSQKLLTQ